MITGCATGFGAMLAQRVLERGETLVATDRDANSLDHLQAPDASRLLKAQLDVTKDREIASAVEAALARFGKVDVLVNNAGVGHGGPIEEATMGEVRFVMDVNALGVMAVTKAVLSHMRARGQGHIINISSDSGKVGFPFQGPYTAAKHAVEGFSEALWHEVRPFGVKVTIIEPCGMFKTAMPRDAIDGALENVKPDSPYYIWASHMGSEKQAGWEHSTDPGLVPDDHPLACGFYPTPAAGADAFLVLGTRLDWTIGFGQFPLFDRDAKVVQVDIVPEVIGKNRPIDVGIVGDAGQVLRQLLAALPGVKRWGMDPAWPASAKGTLTAMREETAAGAKLDERPAGKLMHSIQLVQALAGCLPRDTIKVVDGGYSGVFGIQYLDANVPGDVTWVGSAAHLGVGLAYAIAGKLAHPDKPVVAFMGDGSFGLCAMEFDTAVRQGVPIVVIIANDEGWGEVRDGQRRRFGDDRVVATDLGATRYDEMARALGGYGEFVEQVEGLAPAIQRAFDSGLPAIINVHTDPEQRSTAVAGLPWITE